MFPLVHYFVNRNIYGKVPKMMALGAIWPDLAAGSGFSRDIAHQMGHDFYQWCLENAPEHLDLARGVISHGNNPPCVDYYADEDWPGCEKGWCFAQGAPYMDRVGAATHLPRKLHWWKAHNFVEMSYELIAAGDLPGLSDELLTSLEDEPGKREAARVLAAYTGKSAADIHAMFCKIPQIFAIQDISPEKLAFKQYTAFSIRHDIHDADMPAMAALLEQMSHELSPGYYPFMARVLSLTANALAKY